MGLNIVKSKSSNPHTLVVDLDDFHPRDLADYLADIEYKLIDHCTDTEVSESLIERLSDNEILELVDEEDIIDFAIENIKYKNAKDQEYMAGNLPDNVIKDQCEWRDIKPDDIDYPDMIRDMTGLGSTTLEIMWSEKKVNELIDEVDSFKYLNNYQ